MKRVIGSVLLASLIAATGAAGAEAKCFPAYGNWCGVNYPPPGTNPPPVDVFDNACRNHDLCYAMAGFGSDFCDRGLLIELRTLASRFGYLPRPLQWAESMLGMKSGSPSMPPMPGPGDMMGFMGMMGSDCGY